MARVDSGWLTSVIARLESNPDLRRRLLIVSNNLAFVRDDRLVVGCQEQNGSANGAGPAEVSLRYSTAVRTIMRAAGAPILLSDLADKLATDFPATPADVIDKTLAELVAQRILVTNLRPPMTTTDPLAQVVETLSVTGASDLPEVARLVSDLRQVNAYLAEHDRETSPARRRDLRSCASRSMTAISHVDRPVTVDLRLDCDVALPFGVAHEAEAAAA